MATFHDPEDVGGAWADVMANMPEGWYFRSLRCLTTGEGKQTDAVKRHGPHWRAQAQRRHDLGMRPSGMLAIGDTAGEALWRLADYLTKVKRGSKWAPTFGDATFEEVASPRPARGYADPCQIDLNCYRNEGHEGDHDYPPVTLP